MYAEGEFTLKDMTARLVKLASRVNLLVYYAEPEEIDFPQVRSCMREIDILCKVMEARMEEQK